MLSPTQSCNSILKRSRPALGTFVEIKARGIPQEVMTSAFDELTRLENIFNYHDPNSELSQLSMSSVRSPELDELLTVAQQMAELSERSFDPLRNGQVDLSGIAKGFIVDKLVSRLSPTQNGISGVVNAGGDLCFFGEPQAPVYLRLGGNDHPVLRSLLPCRAAIASSSAAGWNRGTHYSMPWGEVMATDYTAMVQAPAAAFADALTKVALFGKRAIIEHCNRSFDAVTMIFNAQGDLVESFGAA